MGRKRQPPAAKKTAPKKTTPKKNAAKTAKPSSSSDDEKDQLNAKERAQRNVKLVALKLARPDLTWAAIGAEFDLTEKQARNIWKEWSDVGQQELASEDQTSLLHEQVQGFRQVRGELWVVYVKAGENYPAKIGALKAIADLRAEEIKLLQATGRLPKNLGSLEVLLDIRHTTEVFVDWADKWVLGKLEADERAKATLELADVLDAALPKKDLALLSG